MVKKTNRVVVLSKKIRPAPPHELDRYGVLKEGQDRQKRLGLYNRLPGARGKGLVSGGKRKAKLKSGKSKKK